MAAAVIAVANAHLVRARSSRPAAGCSCSAPWRRAQGDTSIGGTIAAVLIGLAAGRSRAPRARDVGGPSEHRGHRAALADLGVAHTASRPTSDRSRGSSCVHATDASGGELAIKVYGRDAYDNQLLAKVWRTLWYRDGGAGRRAQPGVSGGARGAPDAAAANGGAPTAEVVTAGMTAAGDSLLVLRVSGRRSRRSPPRRSTMRCCARAGRRRALGQADIAHGQITPARARRRRRGHARRSRGGTVAPSPDERLTDRAQLLGDDRDRGRNRARGRRGGRRARGRGSRRRCSRTSSRPPSARRCVGASRPPGSTSTTCARRPRRAPSAEMPELAQLRRVTWGTLIQLALLVLAAAAVLSFVSGVDFGELREDLRDASWGWIIAGGHRRAASACHPGGLDAAARSRRSCRSARSTSCSSRRAT